jgi:hypothetical protein
MLWFSRIYSLHSQQSHQPVLFPFGILFPVLSQENLLDRPAIDKHGAGTPIAVDLDFFAFLYWEFDKDFKNEILFVLGPLAVDDAEHEGFFCGFPNDGKVESVEPVDLDIVNVAFFVIFVPIVRGIRRIEHFEKS